MSTDSNEASVQSVVVRWIRIEEQLPPIGVAVPFCCWIDDEFTEINFGRYTGHKTKGTAVVMEVGPYWKDGDWEPCSHWCPLPELDPPSA